MSALRRLTPEREAQIRGIAEAAWRGEVDPDGYRHSAHLVGPEATLQLLSEIDRLRDARGEARRGE